MRYESWETHLKVFCAKSSDFTRDQFMLVPWRTEGPLTLRENRVQIWIQWVLKPQNRCFFFGLDPFRWWRHHQWYDFYRRPVMRYRETRKGLSKQFFTSFKNIFFDFWLKTFSIPVWLKHPLLPVRWESVDRFLICFYACFKLSVGQF